MDEAKLESLRQLDWEEIAAKLANFTRRVAFSLYGWKDGELLPKGLSPEDVVYEVISEFWKNPARFQASCSLTTQLCGVVKQKLWNISQSKESKTTQRENELEVVAGENRQQGPDRICQIRDSFNGAINRIGNHPKVKGKEDHELVVTALSCGVLDPDEIERETGLSRIRIYQVQRELREIYPDIKRDLEKDGNSK